MTTVEVSKKVAGGQYSMVDEMYGVPCETTDGVVDFASAVVSSMMSQANGLMVEEAIGVVRVTCVVGAYSYVLVDVADTAGMGGDGPGMPNALMIVVPTVVGVGAMAVKYGNCVLILKRGVVDRSVVSGHNSDSVFGDAEWLTVVNGTGPRPVNSRYLVTWHVLFAWCVSLPCMTPNSSGLSMNFVGAMCYVSGAHVLDTALSHADVSWVSGVCKVSAPRGLDGSDEPGSVGFLYAVESDVDGLAWVHDPDLVCAPGCHHFTEVTCGGVFEENVKSMWVASVGEEKGLHCPVVVSNVVVVTAVGGKVVMSVDGSLCVPSLSDVGVVHYKSVMSAVDLNEGMYGYGYLRGIECLVLG